MSFFQSVEFLTEGNMHTMFVGEYWKLIAHYGKNLETINFVTSLYILSMIYYKANIYLQVDVDPISWILEVDP